MGATTFIDTWRLIAGSLLALASFAVSAQTSVSGPITSDTTWSFHASPYVVTGDVTISNGAALTIEPGTTVQLQAGASIVVEEGALTAIGLASQRILVTSWRDTGEPTSPAEPGDWGSLVLQDGSDDGRTMLANVDVRYGSGIDVQSASPTFNNLSVDHHAAPAIRVDLRSSPVGSGLSATGNTVNGIVVPAGQIDDEVVWALTGIPYVLEQGSIAVGAMAFGFVPDMVTLAANASFSLQLAVPVPAPAGGFLVWLQSSAPSIVDVPAQVIVAEGETTAAVTVTALEASELRVSITASHSQFGEAVAEVRVIDLPPLLLLPVQATVRVDVGYQFTAVLPEPAPTDVSVNISAVCGACVDPIANVVIAEGQMTANFTLVGRQQVETTLTASADGYASSSATVDIRERFIRLPPSFIVPPGQSRDLTIELSEPAPSGGLSIQLAIDVPGVVATIPTEITVPAGQISAALTLTGVGVGETRLIATPEPSSGYDPASADLVVDEFALMFTESLHSLPEQMWEETKVRLDKSAPAGGLLVEVANSAPANVEINRSMLFIPQGQLLSTAAVRFTGVGRTFSSDVTITASSGGVAPGAITFEVVAPLRLSLNRASVGVGAGLRTHVNELALRLVYGSNNTEYSSRRPLTVRVINPAPDRLSAPTELVMDGWPSSFQLDGVVAGEDIELALEPDGFEAQPDTLTVSVVPATLQFIDLDGHRHQNGPRDNFFLRWGWTGNNSFEQTAIEAHIVELNLVDEQLEGQPIDIVDAIYDSNIGSAIASNVAFPAGQVQTFVRYVGAPIQPVGEYRVEATSEITGSVVSDVQRVGLFELAFAAAPATKFGKDVTLGCVLRLERRLAGAIWHGSSPLVATISNPVPSAFTVPESVTFDSGNGSRCFPVTGLLLTTNPVSITASAPGQTSPQFADATFDIEVITPRLAINAPGSIDVAGLRSYVGIRPYVNDPQEPDGLIVLSDTPASLEIFDKTPSAIGVELYDSPSGGVVIDEVLIAEGTGYPSNDVYTASVDGVGTFRLRATADGFDQGTSDVIQTQRMQLAFGGGDGGIDEQVFIGRGLATSDVIVEVDGHCYSQDYSASLGDVVVTSSHPSLVRVIGVEQSWILQGELVCEVVQVELEALAVPGPGVTVSLSASGGQFLSAEPLIVNVVEPTLVFEGLDGVRSPGSGRDDFSVHFEACDGMGEGCTSNYPLQAEVDVSLAVVNQTPAGLIEGIFAEPEQGQPISSVEYGESAWVGEPVPPHTSGSYYLQAAIAGYAVATSPEQLVEPSTVQLSHRDVHVGAGLTTADEELFVEYVSGSRVAQAPRDVEVFVRCVLNEICSAGKTVIRKGERRASIKVEGVGVGSTSLLVDYADRIGVDKGSVFVSKPQMRIGATNGQAGEHRLTISTYVPRARIPQQLATHPLNIDLRVLPFDAGELPGSVTIEVGASRSQTITVTQASGKPARVVASAEGMGIAEVELVTQQY